MESSLGGLEQQGQVRRNHAGHVVAISGLSLVPTNHELIMDGQRWWTWCAWDALGFVHLLERDGRICSKSPASGLPIEVRFEGGDITADPPAAVLLLASRPEQCVPVDQWCPLVNLFESEQAARAWMERNEVSGELQQLPQAAAGAADHFRPLLMSDPPRPWWRRLLGWLHLQGRAHAP